MRARPAGLISLLAVFIALPAVTGFSEPAPSLPLGGGLPVIVRTGLRFEQITAINENEGSCTATVDLRLRWQDARLAYPKEDGAAFQSFKDAAAEARMATMWVPTVELANANGPPSFRSTSLRIYPEGRVELMQRTTTRLITSFHPQRFPFDQQKLAAEVTVRGEDQDRVLLDYHQDDLDFSSARTNAQLDRWEMGLTNIRREPLPGLYGALHSRLWIELQIRRRFTMAMAPIFIPLFASLLIPLMAIYMNKMEDAEFQIDAFELCNIVIGGLFAVIALNFTVNSAYPMLGDADNTVTRLFGLNYLVLGAALTIIITLFRFNLVQRAFGKYVQEQLYLCLVWAGPLLVLATAIALLLVSMA
jgi:Neurotransmitter-gated ion-channel ligand binding domain